MLLKKQPIIVPKQRNYIFMNLEEHFNGYDFTIPSDIESIRKAIHDVSPEYDGAFEKVMKRKKGHMFNMFLMRKKEVDEFCSWEFSVLEYLEGIFGSERNRLIGYVAEHMLDIWLEKTGYQYIECDTIFLDRKNDMYRKIDFICRNNAIRYKRSYGSIF